MLRNRYPMAISSVRFPEARNRPGELAMPLRGLDNPMRRFFHARMVCPEWCADSLAEIARPEKEQIDPVDRRNLVHFFQRLGVFDLHHDQPL